MSLLVGTTAGLFSLENGDEVVGGTRINHIARDTSGWWAVDGKGRVHHEGAVVATMPEGAVPLCIQPTPETVWVGADRARLYALTGGEIAEDEFFASAPGRDSWHTPWGGPAAIRSMTVDADHTLYVNVHVGGIVRYDNTGLIPTVDISSDVHQVAAHSSAKGAVFAASARGLAASHNGHDFEFRSEGLHATYCRAVAVLEDRVIVTASTGPRSDDARVYTSPLWEGDFTQVTGGLPERFSENVDTHCVIASGNRVHLGQGDTVWGSADTGETWDVLVGGLPEITCLG
jgi:hypothetical protein